MRIAPLLLLALAFPAQAKGLDFFRLGVPKDLVPGVALIQLDVDAHSLITNGAPLKALAEQAHVDVTLIRPIALGWALVEVRRPGDDAIPTEAATLDLIARLAPHVKAAGPDKWMRALRVPNDPGLAQMWHFDIIHAQQAWDVTQGLSSQRIGIVDTGLVRSHEDVGNRAAGGFDFISNAQTANDGDGRDADFNDAGDACNGPASFHGTHVAGTIGATADNGVGVVGLNWNAGLVIARALGVCGGDLVDIGEAAVWLAGGHVDNVPDNTANKVSVMNLSLGSDGGCSGFEQQAVDFVNSQGTLFVAAAGNSGGAVGSPANCNGAVAVAAHGPQRELASYSSFGSEVAIVAPGGDEEQFGQAGGVLSSIGPSGNTYAFEEGTSMATPHVTGAISLLQALNASLTRAQILDILQSSGAACSGCGTKKALVLDAALAAVPGGGGPPPPPPPPPPDSDDNFEENDSFDAAVGGLACNTSLDLVAAAADQDWFLLPTSPGESIDISISSQNGADLDLYALNAPDNNAIVAQSNGSTGNEQIHIDGDGTTLHVLIDPFVDTQNNVQNTGPYTIALACSGAAPPPPVDPPPPPGEDDALEPNNTQDDAAQLFCQQDVDLVADDDDFYAVDVRAGDTLSAQITSGIPLAVQILSPGGAVLGEGTDTQTAHAADLAPGTVFVKVSPTGAHGTYHLKAACSGGSIGGSAHPVAARGGCSSAGGAAFPIAICLVFLAKRRRR